MTTKRIQRDINRMTAEAGRIRRAHGRGAGTFTRRSHVRQTPRGPVAVRRSVPIAKLGRAAQVVRRAPVASYAYGQSLLAPGPRREQAKFAAKLGLTAGAATGYAAGQVLSFGLSVGVAALVCLGVATWFVTKKVEPKAVRKFRERWFRASRALKAELRRAASDSYSKTRKRTAVRRPAVRPVVSSPKPPKPVPAPKAAKVEAPKPTPNPKPTPVAPKPLTDRNKDEATRKFFALRDSGYKGGIDQDGNAVEGDVGDWIEESRRERERGRRHWRRWGESQERAAKKAS